ncbi:MAG: Gfo/Idh/MocA family oxidoreductase [Lachnospiraceae bacterium]|nr:Gfo/Idh/MocA family oxidoreductase [Lachnospiraceae bacterium]
MKIRIGVLGPADIAKRRMIPSMIKNDACVFAGVALATDRERGGDSDSIPESSRLKAAALQQEFGGKIYEGYVNMLSSDEIDAVYIALPPALHFRWAKKALECGKNVLLEKPFTTSKSDTEELVKTAQKGSLSVSENFAFIYHRQISKIDEIIKSGDIGEIRLIRTNFGFPFRGGDDFRYHRKLGGGALLDCGCYTLKLADRLLQGSMEITSSELYYLEGFDVDIYGAVSAKGKGNIPAQLSFGMDQQYNCELEIWGNKGCIKASRIYTAPPELSVKIDVKCGNEIRSYDIEPDDQFGNSLSAFLEMIEDKDKREASYEALIRQSSLVECCMDQGEMK